MKVAYDFSLLSKFGRIDFDPTFRANARTFDIQLAKATVTTTTAPSRDNSHGVNIRSIDRSACPLQTMKMILVKRFKAGLMAE